MNIDDITESKYLKKTDVEPPIRVTIQNLTHENMSQEGEAPEMKYVLHFAENVKPLVLNKTNAELAAHVLGSKETNDWIGKQVVLHNDPTVSFGGKLTGGVRVQIPQEQAVDPSQVGGTPGRDF